MPSYAARIFAVRVKSERLWKIADTLPDAWQNYDDFLSDVWVSYAEEPCGLEEFWREYTHQQSFFPKVWSDAYLAAFARTAGLELITFDKGFTQYKNLSCTILS